MPGRPDGRGMPELPPEPDPEPPPDVHLVTVFETLNPVVLVWAKSALEDAGVHYLVKGEAFRELYGGAPVGFSFNPAAGASSIQVRQEDEGKARALLNDFEESPLATEDH